MKSILAPSPASCVAVVVPKTAQKQALWVHGAARQRRHTHVDVEVGDGFRHGLDLCATEVPEPPRHGGVRDGLFVHVVLRGFHRSRLSEVEAHHLLLGFERSVVRKYFRGNRVGA